MLKSGLLAWCIAVVAVVVAVIFGVQADRALKRAETAEARIAAQEQLEKAAFGLQTAQFVRADEVAHTITYGLPVESRVGDQIFINYQEHTATLPAAAQVYGLPVAGTSELRDVPVGTPLSIRTSTGTDGAVAIEAIYFLH